MRFVNQTHKEVRPVMALTLRWRAPALTGQLVVVALLACLAGAMVLGVLCGGHLDALDAAGAFKGGEIGGVAHYVEALKGNLVWLGGTAMGLVVAVVAILFMAGHSRAHDIAIKTIVGLAILASISGIVA
jgi:hypothetical protein